MLLHLLYGLFGYNIFYIYLFNLFFWYSSILLIIIALYLKFKNKFVLLLFSISFLGNIFFFISSHMKDAISTSTFCFACSIIFFNLIVKVNYKILNTAIKVISIVLILLSMLCRHNFIVTVYPISIFLAFSILNRNKNKHNLKKYFFKFISIMLISAIILLSIYTLFPRLPSVKYGSEQATYVLYAYQITALSVINNDDSMIPLEWYEKGTSFENIKKAYLAHPFSVSYEMYRTALNVDKMSNMKNVISVKNVWLKYILKYPLSFIKFTLRNAFYMCSNNITKKIEDVAAVWWKIDSKRVQNSVGGRYPQTKAYKLVEPKKITFTPLKETIYIILYRVTIDISAIYFIISSIIIFFISIYIFIKKHKYINELLMFSFSISCSVIATAIISSIFTPLATEYRYIYPVIPISIISLISFIAFIYDIGGLKKLLKKNTGMTNEL